MSVRGVDFVSVNILEQPEAWDELAALGVRSVPVVSRGQAFVFGQIIEDVAKFVGLSLDRARLPAADLIAKLHLVLAAAERFACQIPDHHLNRELPGRKRSYRQLVHHIFIVPTAFLDAVEGADLSEAALAVEPPADWQDSTALAAFGTRVRDRLQTWWQQQPQDGDELTPVEVNTYYGKQPTLAVLERTAWHAAQHVRQLMAVLATLNIEPEEPLTADDLAGLPIPEKVWDDDVAERLT